MASDNQEQPILDIILKDTEHPHNMGNAITTEPAPTLQRSPDPDSSPLPTLTAAAQESLLDICSSISSDITHLGLEEVSKHTIEYVDNDNKSVLLVNKYLLSIGQTPIPVIAPGLAPHYIKEEPLSDVRQGSIILYTLDGENASLGILMSVRDVEGELLYKVLTTESSVVVVRHLTTAQVKISMR